MKKILYIFATLALMLSCDIHQADDTSKTPVIDAKVTTKDATQVTIHEAKLNGSLFYESEEDVTCSVWFLYSDTLMELEDLKASGKKVLATLSKDGNFSHSLTGLKEATKYHFVACAKVGDREFFGGVMLFETWATEIGFIPTVKSNPATEIGFDRATLNGSLDSFGHEKEKKEVWFLYSDSGTWLSDLLNHGKKVTSTLMEDGSFSAAIEELDENREYHFVACAKVGKEECYGDVVKFSTKKVEVSVTTGEVVDKGPDKASFEGKVETNVSGILEVTVAYYVRETGGIIYYDGKLIKENCTRHAATLSDDGTIHCDLTGLKPDTEYQYVAYASVMDKEFFGTVKTFITDKTTLLCPDDHHPHAIDLGLGVKWACCNVGASRPEEYGNYFAWGETAPKAKYSLDNYKWMYIDDHDKFYFTKYNTSSEFGAIDNNTVLDPEDDAATANWHGGWRMPTNDEWTTLIYNCTGTLTTLNGVSGYWVTSKKNGNSIFLPAVGSGSHPGSNHNDYWSSSLDTGGPYFALGVYFQTGFGFSNYSRYYGLSVRPVSE